MYTVGISWNVSGPTKYHQTFFAHNRASNLAPGSGCEYIFLTRCNNHTCFPEPIEPHTKWVFASCYSICQLGNQKHLEFIFRVTAHEGGDQASSRGARHDAREEVRIHKRLYHPKMIYEERDSVTKTMKPGITVQYPNEAPPERQRAVAPRLVLTLR